MSVSMNLVVQYTIQRERFLRVSGNLFFHKKSAHIISNVLNINVMYIISWLHTIRKSIILWAFCLLFLESTLVFSANIGIWVPPAGQNTCWLSARTYTMNEFGYWMNPKFCHTCYEGWTPYQNYCIDWTPSYVPFFPAPGSSVSWTCGSPWSTWEPAIGSIPIQWNPVTCFAHRALDWVCGTASKPYLYSTTGYGSDTFCRLVPLQHIHHFFRMPDPVLTGTVQEKMGDQR
jgi:hypothetical protein